MLETISKDCTVRCKNYIGIGYWASATRWSIDSDEIGNVEFYILGFRLLHLFG